MLTAFDMLLITIAIVTMSVGLAKRWSLWRSKLEQHNSDKCTADWMGLIRYLLGHVKLLKGGIAGVFHLVVFWGVVIPAMVILFAQFGLAVPEGAAWILSIVEDMSGIALLSGTLFFLAKRLKSAEPETPTRTTLPAIALLVIVLTGFFAEGARLSITQTGFTWPSPIGSILSLALPASPKMMQLMIRFHFFSVLLFISILPYTFMRHLAAAPLNVVYKKTKRRGQLTPAVLSGGSIGARTVHDLNWKQLLEAEACVSCGRCDENCPAAISGKPLSPQKVIRNILEQMAVVIQNGSSADPIPPPLLEDEITEFEIWECTTCMACVEHCPVFIEPMDKIIDLRRYQVTGRGKLPGKAGLMVRALELFGDAMGKGASHRTDWALNRQVPHISRPGLNPEILFWPGCAGSFHPSYQNISRSMVKILQAANVRFGILGKEESCCGDPARRLGDESLFQILAKKNINRINACRVTKIVTLCPHCLNTLKNEYSDLGGEFEVVHATQFVLELLAQGKIVPKYSIERKMTVHDPCYLGRMNQVYQPLRDVCAAVPGIELMEMEKSRDRGFCCGGGGGSMWLPESFGLGINLIRSEQVAETGVELVGTACPYCLIMLEDGIKSLEMEKPPKVSDIIEIVASSIA